MRFNTLLISVAVAIALSPASSLVARSAATVSHDHWDSEMNVKEQETIRKTFPMTSAEQRALEVNNVFGSIEVVGSSTNEVQLVVIKTIRAESKEKIELAKKEVTLDITQNANSLRLYVNGPFRCNCQDCMNWDHDSGYTVKMDFQIQVPNAIELRLKTVNEGDIKVKGVSGNYAVNNVNGGIEMLNMAGSGKVRTVNGPVKVTFRENPHGNSEYASLNGNVELYFAQNLAADFRFKTFNGGVHSDFPLTALPARAATEERKNGRFIFRSDRYTGGRVGAGGPEIKVENLNGEIRVLESHV